MAGFSLGHGAPGALSEFSAKVYEVLSRYTAFPWPVMAAQCRRLKLDPANLSAASLQQAAGLLSEGVARFTSPEKGQAVAEELRALMRSS